METSLDYLLRFILKMSKIRNTKLFFLIITVVFFASIQLKVYSAPTSLRDVPQSHWARNSVKTLVEDYGFMQGDPNGNFGGSRAISRYEFAKTMTNMLDYLKKQMDADHKDLEGLVSVMEMFQSEIKSLEAKLASANAEVTKQNTTVTELNELVVALGDEYNVLKANGGQSSVNVPSPAPENFELRLTQVEEKVDSLKNRGLLVDTLLRGTLNDVRNVSKGTGKMFKSSKAKLKTPETKSESVTNQEDNLNTSVKEEVRADIHNETTPSPTGQKTELPLQEPAPEPVPSPAPPEHAHSHHDSSHDHNQVSKPEEVNPANSTHEFYNDADEEDLGDIDSFYD
jgi:peptidoglycan hydrolase CwlO-like protein